MNTISQEPGGNGTGKNMLGRLLMELRAQLHAETQ